MTITKSSTRFVAIVAGVAVALSLIVGAFAAAAPAQAAALTQSQINAIVSLLQSFGADAATIANVQASLSGGTPVPGPTTSCLFSRDLTIGATGADVTCLQQALIAAGFSIPAGATGYFGTQTRAAVGSWQASRNIAPAVGYFGPISRGGWNLGGGVVVTPPPGTTPPPAGLQGGAGSIDTFTTLSGLSSETVGESEDDIEIAGVEIENGDGSDIELTAVRLAFSTQPSNDDLSDFVTDVTIWLDGEKVGEVDAADFNEDNSWTRTVSLDSGAIIRMSDKADLTIAVSGVNNIDSADAGDDWALDIVSVRYVDAQAASITDTVTYTAVTWDVDTFATAADVELKANASDDTPVGVVNVDAASDTDGVELLKFTLKAEGSDIRVKDLPITFATSSGGTATTLAAIASTVYLVVDGEEFSAAASSEVAGASGSTVTFSDADFTINDGDSVVVVVKADINDIDGSFAEGDALTTSFTASNRNVADAEDETNENLAAADKTGTATGEALAFYDIGMMATFVSATESMTPGADGTADDDTVTLTMVFDVEAFDGTVYVSDLATSSTAADGAVTIIDVDDGGIVYRYEIDGVATTSRLSHVVSKNDVTGTIASDADEYTFEDGEKARVTLTVTRSNAAVEALSDGFHDMQLVAIGWSITADDDTMNVYEFNLDDFKTDPIYGN